MYGLCKSFNNNCGDPVVLDSCMLCYIQTQISKNVPAEPHAHLILFMVQCCAGNTSWYTGHLLHPMHIFNTPSTAGKIFVNACSNLSMLAGDDVL